jgi:hypothetical protein
VDITPSRDQVVLFEPRAGIPVSDQPALHDLLLGTPPRQLLRPTRWLVPIIGVSGVFLPGHPLGLIGPVVLALFGLISLGVTARAVRFVPRAELDALGASLPRQVRLDDGDLRRSGRVVGIRLPDEDRWLVARLPVADVTMLGRLRRLWVFGPSQGGRIGLLVPGGSGPHVARLASAPPAGAKPVPEPAPSAGWPPPPRDDPVAQLGFRRRLRPYLIAMALVVAVLGWLTVDALVINPVRPGVSDLVWRFLMPFFGVSAVILLIEIVRTALASRATRWACTRVVVVDPPVRHTFGTWKSRVRVDASGDELAVAGPAALVLAVSESEQLWLIGEPGSRRPKIVGIPEVPAVGRAQVIR